MNNTSELISIVNAIPRLSEVLGDTNIHPSSGGKKKMNLFETIIREDETVKIFTNIQTGMTSNNTKCSVYLKTWDSYREIWEIQKAAFIRRYAKLKPSLTTFDADINRYNEVANNAQKEETFMNINFVHVIIILLDSNGLFFVEAHYCKSL